MEDICWNYLRLPTLRTDYTMDTSERKKLIELNNYLVDEKREWNPKRSYVKEIVGVKRNRPRATKTCERARVRQSTMNGIDRPPVT